MAIPAAFVRYVALGDSYTIGTGGPPERSFPAQLSVRWRARGLGVELRNLGVNGYTTDDLIREELPLVAALRPTLTTLLIGANDVVAGRDAETYRARLRAIIGRLVQGQVAPERLVLVSSPDWSRAPTAARFGDPDRVARLVDNYARVARQESQRIGARFHDIVPLSRTESARGMFAPDRLHFSAAAYAEWAMAIDDAMARWGLP